MSRDGFYIYKYQIDAMKDLDDETFKECVIAMCEYAFYKREVAKSPTAKMMMALVKQPIDDSIRKIETIYGRRCAEYHEWRKAVFERDDYTCQNCGQRGGELNAHHIVPYSESIELRYEIDNGITLCKSCHKEIHRRKDNEK